MTLGPPVDFAGADMPTERFRPVPSPLGDAAPAFADLPDADHPEERDSAERLLAAVDVFTVVASMPMADKLALLFGPASPTEPTPVWDDTLLSVVDLAPDGTVFDEIMARFEDLAPEGSAPS